MFAIQAIILETQIEPCVTSLVPPFFSNKIDNGIFIRNEKKNLKLFKSIYVY